jgi:hypothetical protein
LNHLVLRLEVEVLRERPITDGYRCSLSFGQSRRSGEEVIVHDGVLVWEGDPPGADHLARSARGRSRGATVGVARVWMIEPRYLPRFDPGRVLTFVEGNAARVVARAKVLSRHDDDSPSPLADLRAAARRPLA